MQQRRTFGNHVLIKLDKNNDSIKFKDGTKLFIDTSFEVEKHVTVTGEVCGLPQKLSYTGIPNNGMPWKTPMELKFGDRVVVYYLSIVNALKKEIMKAMFIDGERYVFIEYQNIFAAVREGLIVPINGYCLIEPMRDPAIVDREERLKKINLKLVGFKTKTLTDVVYGKVKYLGRPNDEYVDGHSDDGVPIHAGDVVVMKKISDLPLEYDLHANIDGGNKYWRVQRRNIFAKL